VRAGGCGAAYGLPRHAQLAQPAYVDALLEPRQQLVLLVADVLAQHRYQPRDHPPAFVLVELPALEAGHQLVDLLVLALDLERELVTIGQPAPQLGPEHRLLGERVREDQSVDPLQDAVLGLARHDLQLVQQLVELDVLTLLPSQDAPPPAQLGQGLVRK
jgi:hypothetical protein